MIPAKPRLTSSESRVEGCPAGAAVKEVESEVAKRNFPEKPLEWADGELVAKFWKIRRLVQV
jgi:hypothetical protein